MVTSDVEDSDLEVRRLCIALVRDTEGQVAIGIEDTALLRVPLKYSDQTLHPNAEPCIADASSWANRA